MKSILNIALGVAIALVLPFAAHAGMVVQFAGTGSQMGLAEAEEKGLAVKQVKARDLYSRMMKTLAQTGNGWMTFKDQANLKSNQTAEKENVPVVFLDPERFFGINNPHGRQHPCHRLSSQL